MSGISERNPFVGPRPIQLGEALHGRELEIRELYNRLQARRIVVLHSPSGAGKSSLVQAGLIPRLVENGYDVWKPIRVNLDLGDLESIPEGTNRYLLSALISLEDELPELHRRRPAALACQGFLEYIENRPRRRGRSQRPIVLIFDQFEEVLTVAPLAVEAKRAFFTTVGQALETEKCWALFLIREDYLAAFAPYRERIPTQMSNTFRLDLLGLVAAREAAKNLAAEGGRTFPAVDQMVRDLSMVQVQQADGSFVAEQGLYIEPVHLQVVCRRLWDAMPEDDLSIDPEDIEAYASVSSALGSYYASAVRSIARGSVAVERALRDWVGKKLIVGGIRSQVRQEAGTSSGLDNALVRQLLDSYLVRTEPRAGAHWFELSHDRLVEPVQLDNNAWEAKNLHPVQVQAKLWEDSHRSGALLLGAEALKTIQAWAEDHSAMLTGGEREFLDQSREQWTRERAARRRLVAVAVVAAVVALVAGVLGVVAGVARKEARTSEEDAKAQAERAREALVRARDATLMAGARELMARGQPAPATRLLLGVKEPDSVRGWSELAREVLSVPFSRTTLRGHQKEVLSAAWCPTGQRIVTVSADDTARVWAADGKGEPRVRHEPGVKSVAWSGDGKRIVTASTDKTARVWNADGTGETIVLRGHADAVLTAAWSVDGKRIVTASADKTARVWNADGTGEIIVLEGHRDAVVSAAWSPDGQRIVTASDDKTARLWTLDETRGSAVLEGHEAAVSSGAWSPDGLRVVTTSFDKTARVWSVDGSDTPVIFEGHEAAVLSAAWSPDGQRIVTRSSDETARVWRPDRGRDAVVLKGHESWIEYAAWSPDSRYILTASLDRTARVWKTDGSGDPVVLKGHEGGVLFAEWAPHGQRVVTTSADKTARVWDADGTGEPVVLKGHEDGVLKAEWAPGGQRIVTTSADKTARVWNRDGTGKPVVLAGHEDTVVSAAWDPGGQYILSISDDQRARVWVTEGSGQPVVLESPKVWGGAWSPDGYYILTVSSATTAWIRNADGSGEPIAFRGHTAQAQTAEWSPDGQRIVTASADTTARVWNSDGTGEPVILEGHEARVWSAKWSPDGQRILTASEDKTARVWNADGTGTPIVLKGHEAEVRSAQWSPDGPRIATRSHDNVIRVWNADGAGDPIILNRYQFRTAAWSPDGKYIASASSNDTARVSAANGSGEPIVLVGHDDIVRSTAWSPDGNLLATTSDDKTVRIWSITIAALKLALLEASTDCLSREMRLAYLDETEDESRAGYDACERSYERRPLDASRFPVSTQDLDEGDRPEPASDTEPQVRLYESIDYGGSSQGFGPGTYECRDFDIVLRDDVSSIRVPAGLRVTLYKEDAAASRSIVLTADTSSLRDFDGSCSTIQVEADASAEPGEGAARAATYHEAWAF